MGAGLFQLRSGLRNIILIQHLFYMKRQASKFAIPVPSIKAPVVVKKASTAVM